MVQWRSFFKNGLANRYNWWRKSDQNSWWIENADKLNVWAGIIGNTAIGCFFIDGNLTGRLWLQLSGDFKRSPRPPALALLDFFFWGYVRRRYCIVLKPENIIELRQPNTEVCANITPEIFTNVRAEFQSKLNYPQEVHGSHLNILYTYKNREMP